MSSADKAPIKGLAIHCEGPLKVCRFFRLAFVSLNAPENLFTMNCNMFRGIYANAHLIAAHTQDSYLNVIANH
jgi:hypothetical protein